jgi:hypothetical protein
MKHVNRLILIAFMAVAVIAVLFQSCVKKTIELDKLGDQQWQPNLAAPLIYTSLSIADIVTKAGANGSVIIGSDKFCTLIYQGNLFSFMAKDLFVLPPQVYTQTVNLSAAQIGTFTTNGSVTVNFTQTINFNSGTLSPQVDSLIYKSGILTDSIVSDFGHNATIVITIPTATKAGIPFSQTLNVTYAGSTPVISTNSVDLSGYKFDMTNGGTTNNQFKINYAITIKSSSASPVTTANTITIVQKCPNPLFSKIFGYIGQQSLVPASKDIDTVAISIFKNSFLGGTFTLDSIRVKFILYNSFGVPIKADLLQFKTFTPPATTSANIIASPLPIQSPNFTQIGQTLKDSASFDNATNPNLLTEINLRPQNTIYQVSAQANPAGKSPNFIIDTSRVKVDMEVQLPLYGIAKNFKVVDTVKDFKLDITSDNAYIQKLTLRAYVANGFPTDAAIQVIFTDSLYAPVDSLFAPSQLILPSGTVSNGKVIAPSQRTTDCTFDKARIDNLKKTRRALVVGLISTYKDNTGTYAPVKIYSDYKLDLKLGVQSLLNIKISK